MVINDSIIDHWSERIEKNIPGLIGQNQIKFLIQCVELSPKKGQYVNLGTYLGKTTAAICSISENKVISLDTFKYTGRLGRSNPEIVEKNLASLGLNAIIITSSSSSKVPDIIKRIGFLFIDTQHTAKQLNTELDIWLPYMVDKGIVVLHDYYKKYPGYVNVINTRLKNHWEFLGLVGTTIGFRKP